MKIYKKAVFDIATFKILEIESFDYNGPIVLCSGGGGGSYKPPPPTSQEIQIQQMQIQALEREQEQAELFEPAILESLGYRKVFKPDGNEATRNQLKEKITQKTRALSSFTKSVQDSRKPEMHAGTLERMQQEIYDLTSEMEGLQNKDSEFQLEKLPEEKDEITQLLEERQLAALKGDLAVSPALEKHLTTQKEALSESLARKLGGDYMHTTAGMQSLSGFEEQASLTREEARRGQIAMGESLLATRLGLTEGLEQQQLSNMIGFSEGPSSQDYLSALQPFQEQRQAEHQGNVASAQASAQRRSSNLATGASVVGGIVAFAI